MKKIGFLTIAFLLLNNYMTFCQTDLKNNEISTYKKMPQENVYVHYNTSFLLSGEYLYYKVYVSNTNSKRLSNLSKIAYVELVDTDKIPVFKHKIRLNEGLGQGDFFIPASIKSGSYKLIAYTQWMKNIEHNQFFQADLRIINPFQANQYSMLKKNDNIGTLNNNPKKCKISDTNISSNFSVNDYIKIEVNSNSFKNRERAVLTVKSLKNNLAYGNYSISVRKIDTLQIPKRLTADNYNSLHVQKFSSNSIINKINYLPELRGELLSGKVINKDNKSPISNIKVGLSIPGKEPISKIATTNNLGIYYFNLSKEYESSYAIIQVINKERKKFEITLNKPPSISYDNLSFCNFKITTKIKNYLIKRSVYDQIENAYDSLRPNTIKRIDTIIPFFNSKAKIYYLDDYTRFPTIKETVVEIIDEVYIKQKKKNITFHVKLYNQPFESHLSPLVLVDGVLIQNHNDLFDFNVNKIKKISVVKDWILYDSKTFEGLISFETFKGDYQTKLDGNYIKKFKLFKPLEIKKYFNQVYSGNKKSYRIPDYRSQLLWKPNLQLRQKEVSLYFFTSDNKGQYEINLEGFTNGGVPISLRKIINVK